MPTFNVTFMTTIEVEVDNENDATNRAWELLENDLGDLRPHEVFSIERVEPLEIDFSL